VAERIAAGVISKKNLYLHRRAASASEQKKKADAATALKANSGLVASQVTCTLPNGWHFGVTPKFPKKKRC